MQFVDTNIFIRHLTRDDPHKAQACFHLFQRAARREVMLTTSEAIIAEVVYILSSSKQIYQLTRSEIRDQLYPLLSLAGLKIPHRKMYLRALDLYATHAIDFEDALVAAQIERQRIPELYIYDQGFDRLGGLQRIEP